MLPGDGNLAEAEMVISIALVTTRAEIGATLLRQLAWAIRAPFTRQCGFALRDSAIRPARQSCRIQPCDERSVYRAAGCTLLVHSPGRALRPLPQGFRCPRGGLVRVAGGARIRDLVLVGHGGRDERERMRSHFHVRDGRLNFRHVTSDTAASRRSFFVVCMLLEGRGPRTVQR